MIVYDTGQRTDGQPTSGVVHAVFPLIRYDDSVFYTRTERPKDIQRRTGNTRHVPFWKSAPVVKRMEARR